MIEENKKGIEVMMNRRKLLIGAGAVTALGAGGWWFTRKQPVPIGFDVDEQHISAAREFLRQNPAFDIHAHPGRTFVRGAKGLSLKLKAYQAMGTFEKKTVADMEAGLVAAASFASVSDFHLLDVKDKRLQVVRDFAPGEAWNSFKLQNANMQKLVSDGLVFSLKSPNDLPKARAVGKVGAWLTAEGGDFLEGSSERVFDAYEMGLRSITLMHFRGSEIGYIMTGRGMNYGLTTAGKSVVKAMNNVGMMIDLAHASERTSFGVLANTEQPVMCSHTHIKSDKVPIVTRFISKELAVEIANGGGIIGAWPAGFGITDLNGYIDRIFDLIDYVGVDHVALGTDMDANYKPVFDDYRQMPVLVAGLLARGLSREETAKIIGGNFIRLWQQISK
ncbi:MAG: membrane dipeptidase [Robiginitomaculum sp.]|nr:membrane dipeptidase [Robiginitomaculum sp.]